MSEDNSVVVSQEDAEYVIRRQRQEIKDLHVLIQQRGDAAAESFWQTWEELMRNHEWIDTQRLKMFMDRISVQMCKRERSG